jgi:AcrR family transcriptional regulator
VTSRRVAERAGLKSQLVHYYFKTMDDLFVSVYERSERQFLTRHLQAANSDNPLRALWELSLHPQRTRLSQELIALSHHRKPMRKITARILEQTHTINAACIERYLREADVDSNEFPPIVISQFINGLSRGLVNEAAVGVSIGHAEMRDSIERWLDRLEARRRDTRAAETRRLEMS